MKKKEELPPVVLTPEQQAQKDLFMKDYDENVTIPTIGQKMTDVIPAEVPLHRMEVMQAPAFSEEQIHLIKCTVGKDLTDGEFGLFMYLAKQYGLDPIRKQIWAVKYGNAPAQIFTGRDGFLEIAHRSGHFDGMESKVVEYDAAGLPVKATCEVWRDDMAHSFKSEVLFKEYVQPLPASGKKTLWQTKPSVMLIKVAESVCLRKAFSVSGLYAPEEVFEAREK